MNTLPQTVDTVAIVPVRAGSKGLPGKNIMPVNGLPLYLHAVNQGLRTVGRVLLSTNIDAIDDAALPSGCTLCRRPAELAADDTPMDAVIRHLIDDRALTGKRVVLLQATSPLRLDSDILAALELFGTQQYDMVLSVVERDRGVLKYGTLEGAAFSAMREQRFCFFNRQQLPTVHGPNGAVYVFDADRFVIARGFPSNRIGAVEMPIERSADIDTVADLRHVEDMLRLRNSEQQGCGG
jgi:CMP-N,N'-diacetyllegionaminic acid synthase